MTFKNGLVAAAVLATVALTGSARASTITFDDVGPGFDPAIPNGYAGLNWANFFALNAVTYPFGPSGYETGLVSPQSVANNSPDQPSSFTSATPLTLDGFYITAAWRNDVSLSVVGSLAGVVVDTFTTTIGTAGPSHVVLNWSDVDTVQFTTSGGTYAGFAADGTQFALDNLTINGGGAVPEPAAWAMMLLGFAGVGALARGARHRRATTAA